MQRYGQRKKREARRSRTHTPDLPQSRGVCPCHDSFASWVNIRCTPSHKASCRPVSQRFTLEGHNAELWDETARRFEHVAPVELELLPADSMLREFYAGEV